MFSGNCWIPTQASRIHNKQCQVMPWTLHKFVTSISLTFPRCPLYMSLNIASSSGSEYPNQRLNEPEAIKGYATHNHGLIFQGRDDKIVCSPLPFQMSSDMTFIVFLILLAWQSSEKRLQKTKGYLEILSCYFLHFLSQLDLFPWIFFLILLSLPDLTSWYLSIQSLHPSCYYSDGEISRREEATSLPIWRLLGRKF